MTNKQQAAALVIRSNKGAWWIINHNPEIGPYRLREEAEEALRSTRRFYLTECSVDEQLDLLDDILS